LIHPTYISNATTLKAISPIPLMDHTVAYVINTTPKYFYLLKLHLTLLKRYAGELEWPIYIATEEPNHPNMIALKEEFHDITIITLPPTHAGFFESRLAASQLLPSTIKYIFPIQDDFLLEARPDYNKLNDAMYMLENNNNLGSVRVMPCPGPLATVLEKRYKVWIPHEMIFSYQATIWRRRVYETFFQSIIDYTEEKYPGLLNDPKKSATLAIKVNLAEISIGQTLLRNICPMHLCITREHPHKNAVYLAPWPYRPTAVVNGRLEDWAVELFQREGCPL